MATFDDDDDDDDDDDFYYFRCFLRGVKSLPLAPGRFAAV